MGQLTQYYVRTFPPCPGRAVRSCADREARGSALARRNRERTHIVDGGGDGGPQRLRIAGGVREQCATLVRGNQWHRQVARIGVGAQVATVTHRLQARAEQFDPLVVSGGQVVVDFVVGLDQLARQGPIYAASDPVHRIDVGDAGIGPRLQRIEAVERGELRLSVEVPHIVSAYVDDVPGQVALVVEVVGDLGSADFGGAPHLVDAGVGDAALEHQPGRGLDDARTGRQTLVGVPRRGCSVTWWPWARTDPPALRGRRLRARRGAAAESVRHCRWRTSASSSPRNESHRRAAIPLGR